MKKFLSTAATFLMLNSIASAAPMTLNVHDADLKSTIMLVARAGNINVSVDDSVKGNISVAISETEPQKILEIIAKTHNINLIKDGEIYLLTANFENYSPMQSYVLPIHYADAETLRKAIVMSLDRDDTENFVETLSNEKNFPMYRRYESRDKVKDDKDKRDERVFFSPDVNALILYGTQAEYERAKKLMELLDVELKQVSVEAKFLAINKNESKNLGIEWFWSAFPQYPEREITHHQAEYDRWGNQTSSEYFEEKYTRKANDNTGYGIFRFGRGPEGIPFEWYYGARINALVTNGKAKLLSRPNITTIQGHEAVIYVGNTVPIEKSQTTDSITTSSYEYRDAGIKLKCTPRINEDGTITAKLYTEVSTPSYDENTKAYRFNVRTAETTITVRDGEPMIIGGLIGAEEEKSISKIPFLGDLPILGALFRSHKKNKSESELMIFLTAHVIRGAGHGAPANVQYSNSEKY